MREVMELLPKVVQSLLQMEEKEGIEEIRLRISKPLECIVRGKPRFYTYTVTQEDAVFVLNKLSQHSLYTMEEELKRGYVTLQGGHRVGLAGKVITEKGTVKMIRDVSSFNIRVARQKIGVAKPLLPYLYNNYWLNTMVIGPPQTGKTTLLRDIARTISMGSDTISSYKVAIVDERSEIAGCVKGVPQHDLGLRVDVLDACPKAEGMMMLIRSMSPDVIVVDEIGRQEDSEAIQEAIHAGVQLIVTAHGYNWEDVWKRPSIRELMELGVFERFIELSRQKGPGTVQAIKDKQGQSIFTKARVKRT
ncbi:stage III sporulation protein AA [Ectobacillus sp. sgz5001026]|uniref:stage III sporulation protein AA n=1 Tax=Ectobacillus sp. sgz5001026 TaxID=3242473 RepID=UPI0036D39320